MEGESRETDEQINCKKRALASQQSSAMLKSGKIMHCGRSTQTHTTCPLATRTGKPFQFFRILECPQPNGVFNVNCSKMAPLREDFIKFTPDFITKTLTGKVKCAQLVFTLLAGALASSVSSWADCNCGSKMSFLDFVAWTAFINVLIDLIIHLLGLWERLVWIFRHPALHAVLCVLAVVGFLIGSSLAASCAKDRCVTSKSTAGAASFFGFVCLVLFGVEAFLQFQEYRGMTQEAHHQSSEETKQPDYIEPPPSGVV